MKKKYIFISVITIMILMIGVSGYFIYQNEKKQEIIADAKNQLILKDNLKTSFLSEVKISDFIEKIDGTLVDDYVIDTTKVGKQTVEFVYLTDEDVEVKQSYEIEVIDETKPLIWLSGSYNVIRGADENWYEKITCADDYDNNPICEVVGEYDLNKVGSYKLVFKATDSSGNIAEKNFTLNVKNPSSGGSSSSVTSSKTVFSEVVKKHKNENTEIGLDISKWQGDVNFEKLKEAGVEFIFIRVGTTNGKDGDFVLDSKFDQNIKGANEAGIPVGIYFYTYANSEEEAINEAEWILDKIKDYKVDLPIVFDWESWGSFNNFDLSLFGLTNMANVFVDTVREAGYEGMLYSSKTYLENFWLDVDYPIWLAHYTSQANYEGDFEYWQLCNNGRVSGINGDVDINVRYKN